MGVWLAGTHSIPELSGASGHNLGSHHHQGLLRSALQVCTTELVSMPATCSAVATRVERATEVWAASAEGTWAAACRWVAWAAEADCRR